MAQTDEAQSTPTTVRIPSSEYLIFVDVPIPIARKTKIVEVRSKLNDVHLGSIAWFSNWRRFSFTPMPSTTFDVGCMTDIIAFMDYMERDRRSSPQG